MIIVQFVWICKTYLTQAEAILYLNHAELTVQNLKFDFYHAFSFVIDYETNMQRRII